MGWGWGAVVTLSPFFLGLDLDLDLLFCLMFSTAWVLLFKNHRKIPCVLLPAQARNPLVCKHAPVEYSTLEGEDFLALAMWGPFLC